MTLVEEKLQRFIEIAESQIGVTEVGGDNSGEAVEEYQKIVDKKARKEPWCMALVQWCIKKVELEFSTHSYVFKSEGCLDVWRNTPIMCRIENPQVGAIVIWGMYDSTGNPTPFGHCGIVTNIKSDLIFETVEGNTGPGGSYDKINRDGDGVYARTRSVAGSFTMRIEGYILPWV